MLEFQTFFNIKIINNENIIIKQYTSTQKICLSYIQKTNLKESYIEFFKVSLYFHEL